jgi:outer membrane protein assembly factor BamB
MKRASLLAWSFAVLTAGSGRALPQAPTGPARAAPATRPVSEPLPGTAEGGWREFRGDPRNLGVSHGPAPSFTSTRWKFVADSELRNSPAVDGGLVVFGSSNGRLYAVRTKDGAKAWERPVSSPPQEGGTPSGFNYSSPLIRDGRVTIGSAEGWVYCVSLATGDLIWKRQLTGSGPDARIWASPKTDGKRVFIGSLAGTFWALDPASGDVKWKADLGEDVASSAAILGNDVFVPCKDKKLHVFDAATGERRWQAPHEGYSWSAPALHLGFAYLRATGGRIVAIDLVSQSVRWSLELSNSQYPNSSLAAQGDRVYATSAGTLAAFDAQTGDQAWQIRARAAFAASPVIVGDVVVAGGTEDRTLYVVDKKTGNKVKELAIGEKMIATPAIVDGVAYVAGASGTLFAIE